MKGQAYTLFNYLAWAAFFVAAIGVVYIVFNNSIRQATPVPIETINDVLRSAAEQRKVGIDTPVCADLYVSGEITITKDIVGRYGLNLDLKCENVTCREEEDGITIWGSGRLCVEGGVLVWKR